MDNTNINELYELLELSKLFEKAIDLSKNHHRHYDCLYIRFGKNPNEVFVADLCLLIIMDIYVDDDKESVTKKINQLKNFGIKMLYSNKKSQYYFKFLIPEKINEIENQIKIIKELASSKCNKK